jgi:hypothetical protein
MKPTAHWDPFPVICFLLLFLVVVAGQLGRPGDNPIVPKLGLNADDDLR